MIRLSEPLMSSFYDELDKIAVGGVVGKALGSLKAAPFHSIQAGLGAGAGTGALAGAGLGAAGSAVGGYREARESGASRGQALSYGSSRALSGAVKGSVVGAGLGAAGGAAAGHLRPSQTVALGERLTGMGGPVGAAARFGQRQVHGITGWTPTPGVAGSIEKIRGGAYGARQRLQQAEQAMDAARSGKVQPSVFQKSISNLRGQKPEDLQNAVKAKAQKELDSARTYLGSAEKAQDLGATSLGGIAKAFREGRGTEALKAGLKEQWHSGGPVNKAMMFGFPAAAAAGAAMTPDQPGGAGKAERVGEALGSIGYTMAPFTLGASTLAGMGLAGAGKVVGRGLDRLRKPPNPEESGVTLPSEYVHTPAALGQVPEGIA